nr:MAG TPA: hypothetical protein [Inoviridae sp.]
MLPDLIAKALAFILNAALTGLAFLIPPSLLNAASAGVASVADVLKFTPLTSLLALMAAWFAVDTALNTYAFLWNTYRLIPAKFT